jgi:hypothetical protein
MCLSSYLYLTEMKGFSGLRRLYDGGMNKISRTLLVILLCGFGISACTSASGTPAQDAIQPVFKRDAADSYAAVFQIQFSGAKSWTYQLKTLKSTSLREINLHIEGIRGAQNPGDIRMVTDAVTTRMIGAGTDQQCVQFPTGTGMDPNYIYPESLVSLDTLSGALKQVGEEQLDGVTVVHFRATGAASDPWTGATIDLLQEKASGMLRQFSMTASGEDPFFGTGPGKIDASYKAGPLGSEVINPVTGCEISVPLPEAISMFVRLPGLASFESKSSVEELVKFYQTTLPGQNWVEKQPPIQVKEDTILSYQRGAESVEIHMTLNPAGGSAVRLVFIQGP